MRNDDEDRPTGPDDEPGLARRRPETEDIQELANLTPEQQDAYSHWRRIKDVQRYWRWQERGARPPEMFIWCVLPVLRAWRWFRQATRW